MENMTDLPELAAGEAGMGRKDEKIRQDGHCSNGGSRGQGKGI